MAGAQLDAAALALGASNSLSAFSSLGSNGADFLAAWTPDEIRVSAARVSGAGVLLDNPPLAVLGPLNSGQYYGTAVASDGSNYLVLGATDSAVHAKRVTAGGTIIDGTAVVLASGGRAIDATFGAQQYFMAWRNDSRIFAQRVSASLSIVDAQPIAVSGSAGSGPAVAFDGQSTFLVVWSDRRNAQKTDAGILGDIYASRIKTDGTLLDPNGVPVSTAGGTQIDPSVAWNGSSFVIVWQSCPGTQSTLCYTEQADLYGARIDRDGHVLDPAGFSVSVDTSTKTHPRLVSAGPDRVLAAYSRAETTGTNGPQRIRARFICGGAACDLVDDAGAPLPGDESPAEQRE
jgi:hypothetical protein